MELTLFVVLLILAFGALVTFAGTLSDVMSLKQDLKNKQEFIDKHLLVIEFSFQTYVLPYVPGTKQTKVFLGTVGESPSATSIFIAVDVEKAKQEIGERHHAQMEEFEHLGM